MKAELWSDRSKLGSIRKGQVPFWSKHARIVMMALSGIFAAAGFLINAVFARSITGALGSEGVGFEHVVPWTARVLYGFAILAGGWYVASKALFSARRLRPDMNLLMTIAVLGAVAIGEWLEAAVVSFLFAVSLALESWSIGRARHEVEALLDLAPPTVRILKDGREVETNATEVAVGSVFLVKPGDRIPLDGEVVLGASEVNQAPITGESVPILRETGAQVFAGTINGTGTLQIRSTKAATDTTLAHIIELVGAAQAKRAPSEQWVEHFARHYTPIIFAAALKSASARSHFFARSAVMPLMSSSSACSFGLNRCSRPSE